MPATYNPWGEPNVMGPTWAGGLPRPGPRQPAMGGTSAVGGMFKPASPLRTISRGLPRPAMTVIGGSFDPGPMPAGGSRGGGGDGGGFTASYAPRPQGGINAHLPKPGEMSPQDNFERARARGEITPDKIKQAQAFGAAHGYDFDPASGYTKKPGWTPPPVPGGRAPQLPQPPDEMQDPQAMYGAATGTAKGGVPLRQLEGLPFWTGERGPELQEVKDGKLHVVPNHVLNELGLEPPPQTRPLATLGFADGTEAPPPLEWAPAQELAPAPIGRFGVPGLTPGQSLMAHGQRENPGSSRPALPPLPGAAPVQAPAPATLDFTPAPAAAPTPGFDTSHFLSPPPGVRRTDFRRFMQSPQGLGFALGQQADAQRTQQHNDFITGMSDRNYQRSQATEQRQKAEAKQQKAEEEAKANAAYDQIFGALTSNQAALPPVFKDLISSAKDVKAKAALHDVVLGYLGHKTTSDLMGQRQADADQRDQEALNTWAEIPGAPDHLMNQRGQIITRPGKAMSVAEQMQALQALQSQYGKTHKFTLHPSGISAEPVEAQKPNTRAPTVREIRKPGTTAGQTDQIDYQQWYPDKGWGPMQMMPNSSPSDADKMNWMRQNGYKPDKAGQYPATGWTRAFHALSGQADAAASKPNWKAWAEQ